MWNVTRRRIISALVANIAFTKIASVHVQVCSTTFGLDTSN
jgi:hypothetical protein